METDAAVRGISDALMDAAYLIRHDRTAAGNAIAAVETALAGLRKIEDATLAELHGHTA